MLWHPIRAPPRHCFRNSLYLFGAFCDNSLMRKSVGIIITIGLKKTHLYHISETAKHVTHSPPQVAVAYPSIGRQTSDASGEFLTQNPPEPSPLRPVANAAHMHGRDPDLRQIRKNLCFVQALVILSCQRKDWQNWEADILTNLTKGNRRLNLP